MSDRSKDYVYQQSDDWQVVEEALPLANGQPLWPEALAALARLREREAQMEAGLKLQREAWGSGIREREAAEARVAELTLERDMFHNALDRSTAQRVRLEEALREIAELTSNATIKEGSPVSYALGPQIARRALVHEEEA